MYHEHALVTLWVPISSVSDMLTCLFMQGRAMEFRRAVSQRNRANIQWNLLTKVPLENASSRSCPSKDENTSDIFEHKQAHRLQERWASFYIQSGLQGRGRRKLAGTIPRLQPLVLAWSTRHMERIALCFYAETWEGHLEEHELKFRQNLCIPYFWFLIPVYSKVFIPICEL